MSAVEVRVAVRVQQALLGRHECSSSVDRDRATFEHHRRVAARDAEALAQASGDRVVPLERRVLPAPTVEPEVDRARSPLSLRSTIGPLSRSQESSIGSSTTSMACACPVPHASTASAPSPTIGDDQHRLEARHRGDHRRVGDLGRGELVAPQLGARGPRDECSLVRRPLGWHREAVHRIVSSTSSKMSRVVLGLRNTARPTTSPCQRVGSTNATWSRSSRRDHS